MEQEVNSRQRAYSFGSSYDNGVICDTPSAPISMSIYTEGSNFRENMFPRPLAARPVSFRVVIVEIEESLDSDIQSIIILEQRHQLSVVKL